MELYITTVYDISKMQTIVVGVFSSIVKAKRAGVEVMSNIIQDDPFFLDWDYSDNNELYFYSGFTLSITHATLDQLV